MLYSAEQFSHYYQCNSISDACCIDLAFVTPSPRECAACPSHVTVGSLKVIQLPLTGQKHARVRGTDLNDLVNECQRLSMSFP